MFLLWFYFLGGFPEPPRGVNEKDCLLPVSPLVEVEMMRIDNVLSNFGDSSGEAPPLLPHQTPQRIKTCKKRTLTRHLLNYIIIKSACPKEISQEGLLKGELPVTPVGTWGRGQISPSYPCHFSCLSFSCVWVTSFVASPQVGSV